MCKLSLPDFDICSNTRKTESHSCRNAISSRLENAAHLATTRPDARVHLWRGSLHVSAPELVRLAGFLSADERERAGRFRFSVHRNRFIAGRGMTRSLLAQYLDCDPGEVAFEYSRFGKPELKYSGPTQLHFNLAHTESLFALAISSQPVGVDLELRREIPDLPQLLLELCSDAERHELHQSSLTVEKFLRLWTRKEALLKGIGCGITEHVKNVSVFFDDSSDIIIPPALSGTKWLIKTESEPATICTVATPVN